MKNSSTIILPQWYHILKSLSLKAQVIPDDIRTHWNTTYNMLNFAYQYRVTINKIMDIHNMKLHAYEVEAYEWETVQQLHDLLKVNNNYFFISQVLSHFINFQRHNFVLLMW